MKHARPMALFVLFILLCASLACWGMQMFMPVPRPHAPPPDQPAAGVEAAGALFGGRVAPGKASSHFQLRGILNAGGANSVAVISINGQPANAIVLGAEVSPGVTLSEVHERHVLLSENGTKRQIDLQELAKKASAVAPPPVTPLASSPRPVPPAPPPPQASAPAASALSAAMASSPLVPRPVPAK